MILYILTVAVIVLIIAMFIVAWNVYLDNLSTQRLCDAVFRLCSKMDEKPKKPRSDLLSPYLAYYYEQLKKEDNQNVH